MKSTIQNSVEPAGRTAATASDRTDGRAPAVAGADIDKLASNYHAIVRGGAIYYPVAYRFGRELGRGRQGVVFEAFRHGARGCVTRHAIKIFDPRLYSSAEKYWTDMGRIADQISRMHRLRSPNLVSRDVYEEVDGVGYIQMEAVEGVDCGQLLYGNHFRLTRPRCKPEEWARFMDVVFRPRDDGIRIQPGIALYIMRQTLRGLEILHRAGFVHSDIKPANIMLDRLGIVKLVDYGRATRHGEKMRILLGTPLYMAPEVHRREPNCFQSDLYSVGLLGLELLRGRPLVPPDQADEETLLEFKMNLPDMLDDLLPGYVRDNRAFVQLLRRFLDPDASKRYESALNAESTSEGLALLHKQLTFSGKDTEYDREIAQYIGLLFPEQQTDGNRPPGL